MRKRAKTNSPPAPKVRKGEESAERILEIAARLFSTHGYEATTLRSIADVAGLKTASLYYHFKSKDELLDAVVATGLRKAVEAFQAAQAELAPDSTFEQRLHAAVRSHLKIMQSLGPTAQTSRQLLTQLSDAQRQKHLHMRTQYEQLWSDLLQESDHFQLCRPGLRLGIVRLFLLGAINWSTEWMDPKKESIETISTIATDFFLRGIVGK